MGVRRVRTTERVQATDGSFVEPGAEGVLLATDVAMLGKRGCDVRLDDGRTAYLLMPTQYDLLPEREA